MIVPLQKTIKGFYVYLLSSFYIGVRSFVKSTGFFFLSPPRLIFFFCSPGTNLPEKICIR